MEALDEEFATSIDCEDKIIHVMIRLYYELKDKLPHNKKQCVITKALNSSRNFEQFLTMTEQYYDASNFKTSAEQSFFTSSLSDLQSRGEWNKNTFLAPLDLQTQDSLHSRAFKEYEDMTTNKTGCSSSPIMSAQATYRKCFKHEVTNVQPGKLKEQDETQVLRSKTEVISEAEERTTEAHPKRIVVARTRQHTQTKKACGRLHLKNQNTFRKNYRITRVQSLRKQRKLQAARKETKEHTTEYKTVEDWLRVSAWLRRVHRQSPHGPRRRPLRQFPLLTASPNRQGRTYWTC